MSLIDCQTDEHLVEVLEQNPDVVVYFTAPWCGPCRALSPHLPKIVDRYDGLVFLKVNADVCEKAPSICSIAGYPTFIMFRNGQEQNRVMGAKLMDIIEAIDKTYL